MGKLVMLKDDVVTEKLINHPEYKVVPSLNNQARKDIIKHNSKIRIQIFKELKEEEKKQNGEEVKDA